MRFFAYPNYKASGIEWLTDIPVHWKVMRVKHTTYVKGRIGWQGLRFDEFIDEGPFLVTGTDFKKGKIDWSTCYHISGERYREDPYIQLRENDLLITKDGTIGKVAIVNSMSGPASLNSGVFLTRAKGSSYETRFMYWVLSSEVFASFIEASKSGTTIAHLYQNVFVEFAYPVPSLQEQRAIADFLDREAARLDALLTRKQTFIERLREKRSALISQTVTRGLPPQAARAAGLEPHPKLKSSGIEWLHDIPVHWQCAQLRRFTHMVTSGSRGWAEYYTDEGDIFVRIGNLTRDSRQIDLADVQYVSPPLGAEGERTRIKAGDLLFSITAYLGSVAVASESVIGGYISQHIALVRLDTTRLLPDFAAFSTLADVGQNQLAGFGYGGTKVQLSLDDVKSLWLPIPPLAEQRAIVTFLDRETAKIDSLVAKVEEATERLQEYRTALITAAVTGKIDVRNAGKNAASGASQ